MNARYIFIEVTKRDSTRVLLSLDGIEAIEEHMVIGEKNAKDEMYCAITFKGTQLRVKESFEEVSKLILTLNKNESEKP